MHRQKQNNHHPEFTLLELMAGILAAVALPLWAPFKPAVMGGKLPLVGSSPPLVVLAMTVAEPCTRNSIMNTQRGFTILELMITLLIAGILTAFAGPSFIEMTRNNRLTTQANELILALNLSRSEAVKRGASITIKPNTGTNWSVGWTVEEADGTDLRISDPLQGGMTMTSTSASITYQPSGIPTALPGNFSLCDGRTGETGRTISISLTGRVSVANLTCS